MTSTERVSTASSTAASTANDETEYSEEYDDITTIPSVVRTTTEAERERNIIPLEVIQFVLSQKQIID